MKEKLMKMMAKKKDLSPAEKKAKMSAVKDLKSAAHEAMGSKMDHLKKVSVMSDSPQGLEHGLDMAKHVVSNPEMLQMKDHAENDMGDYKSALEEHANDEPNQEDGWVNDENRYAEGGQVSEMEESPDKGDYDSVEAEDNNDGSEEESPDQGMYEAVDQESPADHEEGQEDEDNEFHGLDMNQLDEKLKKLMMRKKSMESR